LRATGRRRDFSPSPGFPWEGQAPRPSMPSGRPAAGMMTFPIDMGGEREYNTILTELKPADPRSEWNLRLERDSRLVGADMIS
jgi:hypothetical protein